MFFIRDKESEEERERMKKTKEIATSAQNDLSIKSIKYKRNTNDEKIVKTKWSHKSNAENGFNYPFAMAVKQNYVNISGHFFFTK